MKVKIESLKYISKKYSDHLEILEIETLEELKKELLKWKELNPKEDFIIDFQNDFMRVILYNDYNE